MENEKVSKQSEAQQKDDLEKIKDIGVAFARALYSIGISQYSQLMAYSEEQLAAELEQKAGVKVSPDRIKLKNWIGQAKELAAGGMRIDAAERKADVPEQDQSWKQYAGFSVFFDYKLDEEGNKQWHTLVWKTKAYHDESGETTEFKGIGPANWVNWILQMANLEKENLQTVPISMDDLSIPPDTATIDSHSEGEGSPLNVTIDSMVIKPTPDSPSKTVTADLDIHFSGEQVKDLLNKKIPVQLELQTIKSDTGAHELAAYNRQTVELDTENVTTQLAFPIPNEIGRYEIQAIIFLLPPYQAYSIKEGYSLKVVP